MNTLNMYKVLKSLFGILNGRKYNSQYFVIFIHKYLLHSINYVSALVTRTEPNRLYYKIIYLVS